MLQSKFLPILEKILRSTNYSEESYNGLQYGVSNVKDKAIKGVLITENITIDSIQSAKKKGCNFIIAYNPLLISTKDKFRVDESLLNIITLLNTYRISVYSIGNYFNDSILKYFPETQIENILKTEYLGGNRFFGFTLSWINGNKTRKHLIDNLKRNFNMEVIKTHWFSNQQINRIAFLFRELNIPEVVNLIYNNKVNLIFCPNISYTSLLIAKNYNLSIVEFPYSYIIAEILIELKNNLISEIPHLNFEYFDSKILPIYLT